ESREVGNEIGLPHVAARAHRHEIALAAERLLRAFPFGKLVVVGEDESLVVKQIEHQAEMVGGGEPRALAAAGIEMLVATVERQREQALRPPFEAVLAAIARLYRGAAVAGERVDHLLEHVFLRRGLRARRE